MALVTREEARSFVRGLQEETDDTVDLLVAGAEALVATYLGWPTPDDGVPSIERATYTEHREDFRSQVVRLRAPALPVVASVDTDATGQFNGEQVSRSFQARDGFLILSKHTVSDWIRIVYDAGFTAGTLPTSVRTAILLVIRELWVLRMLFDLPNWNPTERFTAITADVKTLLFRYRSLGVAHA